MVRLFVFNVLSIIYALANATTPIESCDKTYTASSEKNGNLIIQHGASRLALTHIDHNVFGGVFSLDNSLLIVFGSPIKVDKRHPQVTHLSIFSIKNRPKLIMTEIYGGGVFDVSFSVDQQFASIDNQFGIDVINLNKKSSKLFDATYAIDFPLQQCQVDSK